MERSRWLTAVVVALAPLFAGADPQRPSDSARPNAGDAASTSASVDQAQHQITAYLEKLADLHCTESVTQEKLTAGGRVEATEHAKYDYLIMMSGSGEDFQLNESRIESASARNRPTQSPMLITNGVATVLLVFHPYYRDSFTFEVGDEEMVNGRPAVPVHFEPVPGRRTPAVLALRGREYPLELEGTAWLDNQSGEVVKVEAKLLHDMSDVGLSSLVIHVEYKPGNPGKDAGSLTLPALAVVEVTTPRQHWRNTHVFDNYRGFSIEAEQDPNVKVRGTNTGPDGTSERVADPPDPKEP
jgi:hypothetical protein